MVALITYCAAQRGEDFDTTNEDIDRTKIVDCEWQPAMHYFQGVIRGISGIKNNKPFLLLPNKTPFHQGIWYVQSRLLRNTRANNLALKIPKVQGLFTYTANAGKGLTMAENINLATLINEVIDKLVCPGELWKICSIAPESLKSQQVLKHKRPSSKKIVYYKGEIVYLTKEIDKQLNLLDEPLTAAYNAVVNLDTYNKYVDAIKLYNKKYSDITKLSDEIASIRYPILFRKGIKGDQVQRLESLDVDELNKVCPVEWNGLSRPILVSPSDKDVRSYLALIKELEDSIAQDHRSSLAEWKSYVIKTPVIAKFLKATGTTSEGYQVLQRKTFVPPPGGDDDFWGEEEMPHTTTTTQIPKESKKPKATGKDTEG